MSRDVRQYLADILESIDLIEEYTRDVTRDGFSASRQLQDAVFRRLEIIGEAVKHIPPEILRLHPAIPWRQVAGFRDVLIHEYFGVNVERTWAVVQEDLPALKVNIIDIKDRLEG